MKMWAIINKNIEGEVYDFNECGFISTLKMTLKCLVPTKPIAEGLMHLYGFNDGFKVIDITVNDIYEDGMINWDAEVVEEWE